jgi:hypothetical protein
LGWWLFKGGRLTKEIKSLKIEDMAEDIANENSKFSAYYLNGI